MLATSNRRRALGLLSARVFAGVLAVVGLGGCASPPPACQTRQWVFAGSDAGRVLALPLDACSGRLGPAVAVAEVPKPRWLLAHPRQPVLYATTDSAPEGGRVLAFNVDRGSAALQPLNAAPAGGGSTTQLWLDLPSQALAVANFANGTTSTLALQPDGRLGASVSTVAGTGSGPHRRQNGPHAHGVAVDPSHRWVLTADLGADRLFVNGYDPATRQLQAEDLDQPRALALPAGSGPRHFVFGADGRFVYLLNELSADIAVLRWNADNGRLSAVQTVPLSRAGFTGTKSGSGIVISADGRTIYAGERGEHHVVVLAVNPGSGELSLLQHMPSGGELPWALALQPQGRWLLVANQRSHSIKLFGVDPDSGRLFDTGQSTALQSPVSLAFLPD